MQAMDRRIAAVFYLDVKYGSTKGAVTAGQTMISATTGHNEAKAGRRYAMARVVGETLTDDAGGTDVLTGTVTYAPGLINPENIKIYSSAGELLGAVSGVAGKLPADESWTTGNVVDATSDSSGVTGTVEANGDYNLDFSATDLGSGTGATITYDYQYDLPVDSDGDRIGVPEVDVAVRQETVEAIDFPLRAKYSIGAQIDLMKAHGINLESELVKYLGGEVDKFGLKSLAIAA